MIRLLGYVEDPRQMTGRMTKKEKGWLRGVSGELDFDDPALSGLFPAQTLEQALQAFVLLTDGD